MGEQAVTWASRTERSDGKTSPEELIAAAHASCFAMALSNVLDEGGTPPETTDPAVPEKLTAFTEKYGYEFAEFPPEP
jgi:organic hydroperoxide reductase OsmC/OhrA